MVQRDEQLIDGLGPEGVSHLRAIDRDPNHTRFFGAVIGDIGKFEARDLVPDRWIEYLGYHGNEDKRHNREVIDWLSTQDPRRVFLETPTGSYTFGEMVESIHYRPVNGVEVLRPRLDAGSVVDVLAVMARGTAVLTGPDAEPPETKEPNGAATVIFTSGTTGGPKGVRLTRGNWEAAARASQQYLGNDSRDVWLLTMGMHRVGGLAVVLRSALSGGRVRIPPRVDAKEISAALRSGVTFVSLVPTMLRRILEFHPGPYSGVRTVLVGGGPIPDGLMERAARAGLPVLASYGLTETCGQVATARPGSSAETECAPVAGRRVADRARRSNRGEGIDGLTRICRGGRPGERRVVHHG